MTHVAAALDRELGQVTPLHVLTLLCKYRNPETLDCFPSMKRLAKDLGLSDRRSIQRHIDRLVECGYPVVIPRRAKDGSTNTSNGFLVLYPAPSWPTGGDENAPTAPENVGVTPSTILPVVDDATGAPRNDPAPRGTCPPAPVAHDDDPRGGMCRTNHHTGITRL